MKPTKSQFELIKFRKSERSFLNKDIKQEELELIIKEISSFKGPFEDSTRVKLIINDKDLNTGDNKLGTYGVIKGAKYYLAAIANKNKQSLFELGYVVEKAVLYLLEKNLGTCWLGGTFNRGKFGEKVSLEQDEYLPIVIPFGYSRGKQSIADKVFRFAASSDKRKSWEELFFIESLDSPLLEEEAGKYKLALEALRLAPSASNKQPWRVIKTTNGFEFYLKPTQGYGEKLSFNIQEIDIGIAMCHFELVAREEGKEGKWNVNIENFDEYKSDLIHIATWKTT